MTSPRTKHQRIKAACIELEQAITIFEDESEDQTQIESRASKEVLKIKEVKIQLSKIKQQLDELSN